MNDHIKHIIGQLLCVRKHCLMKMNCSLNLLIILSMQTIHLFCELLLFHIIQCKDINVKFSIIDNNRKIIFDVLFIFTSTIFDLRLLDLFENQYKSLLNTITPLINYCFRRDWNFRDMNLWFVTIFFDYLSVYSMTK